MEDKLKKKIDNLDNQDGPEATNAPGTETNPIGDQPSRAAKIELDEPDEANTVESFVQLAKLLASEDVKDINEVISVLNKALFIEDDEIMYNARPAQVYYRQLPIVINDEIKVKVVLLVQADSLALIIPEHVSEVYEELVEDPGLIIEKNKNLDLYAELYNFNANDAKLHDVIKSAYLSAGDFLRAFDIPKELEDQAKQDTELEGEEQESDWTDDDVSVDSGSNFDNMFGGGGSSDFEEMDSGVEDFGEFEENAKHYEGFRKQSDVLEDLAHTLYNKVDTDIREFIKIKFTGESKSVLVIEVDNKSIFDKYQRIPKMAKRIMTAIGESIRRGQFTQLVDSFIKEDKRYFVVAEEIGNNFWITESDKINKLDVLDDKVLLPIQENIIKLKRSSIRMESRVKKPYLLDGKIVFK
jgi:hypothetical protein